MDEKEADVLAHVIELEESVPRETMLSIVYIAGYIDRFRESEADDTMSYYKKYPDYIAALDRGNLRKPTDNVVQWTVYCFIIFSQNMERSCEICRNFLVRIFTLIATKYEFDVSETQCRTLANMWLKNFSIISTPKSAKEAKLKQLK